MNRMSYRLYCCLAFFLLSNALAFGQDQKIVDSLLALLPDAPDTSNLEVYISLAEEYFYTDHQKAKHYVDAYLDIARKYKSPPHIAFGTNMLGVYYNITSQNKEGDEDRVSLLHGFFFQQANISNVEEGRCVKV